VFIDKILLKLVKESGFFTQTVCKGRTRVL